MQRCGEKCIWTQKQIGDYEPSRVVAERANLKRRLQLLQDFRKAAYTVS